MLWQEWGEKDLGRWSRHKQKLSEDYWYLHIEPFSGCCMMLSLLFSQKKLTLIFRRYTGIRVYENETNCVRNNSMVRFWCLVIHKILEFNQRELKQMESILQTSILPYKKGLSYWWYTGIRRLQSKQDSILENFIYQF